MKPHLVLPLCADVCGMPDKCRFSTVLPSLGLGSIAPHGSRVGRRVSLLHAAVSPSQQVAHGVYGSPHRCFRPWRGMLALRIPHAAVAGDYATLSSRRCCSVHENDSTALIGTLVMPSASLQPTRRALRLTAEHEHSVQAAKKVAQGTAAAQVTACTCQGCAQCEHFCQHGPQVPCRRISCVSIVCVSNRQALQPQAQSTAKQAANSLGRVQKGAYFMIEEVRIPAGIIELCWDPCKTRRAQAELCAAMHCARVGTWLDHSVCLCTVLCADCRHKV